MRQLELTYPPSHVGRVAWRGNDKDRIGGMLEVLSAAVEHLGRKDVVDELDINKSTLSEALNEKNDKRWAGEWTCVVLAMLTRRGDERSAELQRELLEAMTGLAPRFVLADADNGMTDEELEAMERAVAREKAKRRKRAA